jgi:hypothetical protein
MIVFFMLSSARHIYYAGMGQGAVLCPTFEWDREPPLSHSGFSLNKICENRT